MPGPGITIPSCAVGIPGPGFPNRAVETAMRAPRIPTPQLGIASPVSDILKRGQDVAMAIPGIPHTYSVEPEPAMRFLQITDAASGIQVEVSPTKRLRQADSE